MMLGAMRDPSAVILAVVLTAVEEALLRSTMVFRDSFFRVLIGKKELSDAEFAFQRRRWAAATARSMYIEFVAIITSRVLYLAFRQHRFVVNFGYGFDSTDENMTSLTMLFTSAFIELIFEAVVDAYALGQSMWTESQKQDVN